MVSDNEAYRKTKSSGRLSHTIHIAIRPEESNLVVLSAISFKAFEQFLSIVKDFRIWMQLKRLNRHNSRGTPAIDLIPVDFDHMISTVMSEHQTVPGWLRTALLLGQQLNDHVGRLECLGRLRRRLGLNVANRLLLCLNQLGERKRTIRS